MKRAAALIAAPFFMTLFSGCVAKKEFVKVRLPKLRTCKVTPAKVKVTKVDNKVCMELSEYKKLKKQNYRLRVCNELLNKQNIDFNKRFAK